MFRTISSTRLVLSRSLYQTPSFACISLRYSNPNSFSVNRKFCSDDTNSRDINSRDIDDTNSRDLELEPTDEFYDAMENVQLPLGWTGTVQDIVEPMLPVIYNHNVHDTVRSELGQIKEMLETNPFTRDLLNDVYRKTKFEGVDISSYTRLILAELGRRGELKLIPKIYEAVDHIFTQVYNEHNVQVTLAVEPTPEEIEQLEEELRVYLFKNDETAKITLSVEVNPAIIAGRVYRFRDGLLNMSVSQFMEEYKDARLGQKQEEEQQLTEFLEESSKPLNADQPASNKRYQDMLREFSKRFETARGLRS